ncbi:protein translocase subunit SecF [Paenibacillus lutrae]|uniref:Protein-export membrane protein SecF n=1 Tax=Paenibacillus lutrae TaxID=2078573 RepID=A0A7X3FHD5_9BACL|nr:protein translocase subunit SecF [Paenibacillus lutrae]
MNYSNKFNFVAHRKIFFIISSVIIAAGVVALLLFQMNYGVDFKAGTSIDVSVGQAITKEKAQEIYKTAGFDQTVTIGGSNSDRVSTRFDEILGKEQIDKIKAAYAADYKDKVSMEVNTVSPDIAKELAFKAIIGVLIASVAISIYVSIRFEWRFALAAIISILHDAVIVVSMFAIFRFQVDLPFVAAVLTTVGYSINDKIVIFDRIRENLRFSKLKTPADLELMVHDSIWQTMARNINTVITVLIAAICLFIFGSESIKLFALAKIIGLTSGAYSSICIASPLWYMLKKNSLGSKRKVASAAEAKE